MRNLDEFYVSAKEALNEFLPFIEQHDLKGRAKADHICYKCASPKSFETIKILFESGSRWIYQSIIAGRRIALIKLTSPLESVLGEIDLLELSDQKPDGSQTEGFDHIEAYAIDGDYSGFVDYFKARGVEVKEVRRPHHTTHDIKLDKGLIFRLTQGPLAEKIKKEMG
jgi:predicted metalloenzyme YecM